jgi:hypothetical protein
LTQILENSVMSLPPDEVHRTVLLGAHDGSQPTLDAARTAHERTGILICADASICHGDSLGSGCRHRPSFAQCAGFGAELRVNGLTAS